MINGIGYGSWNSRRQRWRKPTRTLCQYPSSPRSSALGWVPRRAGASLEPGCPPWVQVRRSTEVPPPPQTCTAWGAALRQKRAEPGQRPESWKYAWGSDSPCPASSLKRGQEVTYRQILGPLLLKCYLIGSASPPGHADEAMGKTLPFSPSLASARRNITSLDVHMHHDGYLHTTPVPSAAQWVY